MSLSRHTGAIAVTLLCAAALVLPRAADASGAGPDRAFRTPIAHGAASARTAVSGSKLNRGLARLFRRVGKSGAFVVDASDGQVLFSRKGGRRRILASNSKIFTTAAALGRFEPDSRLETTVWSEDSVADGVSEGLFLRGGGDPTLNGSGLSRLAARVRSAGVSTVHGPLIYDDSFLDRVTSIPQHGITPERIGTLSALTIDGGGPSDPAKDAAKRFADALRKAGVAIGNSVSPGIAPRFPPAVQVTELGSPTMADLIEQTNVPSNNFLAEMLLKDLGGQFGESGSTASGISVVKSFAADRGASFKGENGSGLSRRNRASPASVVHLLASMLQVKDNASPEAQAAQRGMRDAFVGSFAIAGRSGTVARRLRGSAAQDNCHLKTGTLTRVSALSGYCFHGGEDADHAVIFSLLMNKVDVNRAHLIQDRMAALIARFSG